MAAHEFAQVDGDFTAIADDDDAAARCEKFQVMGEVHIGEHFKNDVNATAARRFQDFFLIARLTVIENSLRSFALCEVQAFLRAGGAQDSEAHGASPSGVRPCRHLHSHRALERFRKHVLQPNGAERGTRCRREPRPLRPDRN